MKPGQIILNIVLASVLFKYKQIFSIYNIWLYDFSATQNLYNYGSIFSVYKNYINSSAFSIIYLVSLFKNSNS